jgi:hypothetical protein
MYKKIKIYKQIGYQYLSILGITPKDSAALHWVKKASATHLSGIVFSTTQNPALRVSTKNSKLRPLSSVLLLLSSLLPSLPLLLWHSGHIIPITSRWFSAQNRPTLARFQHHSPLFSVPPHTLPHTLSLSIPLYTFHYLFTSHSLYNVTSDNIIFLPF